MVEVEWRERGTRGLWEYVADDGRVLGGVHEIRRNQWSGWSYTMVKTREYRFRVEAQHAVEQLLEVGAYPFPKPEPRPVRKVWKRVPNQPE